MQNHERITQIAAAVQARLGSLYYSSVDSVTRSLLDRSLGTGMARAVAITGGFSGSPCWSVELADHRRVFVKAAVDDVGIAGNRNEAAVLTLVSSRHLPSFTGLFDDGRVLVIEDLTSANWSVTPDRIDELWAAITEIGSHQGPDMLRQSYQGSGRDTWAAVTSDDRFSPAVGLTAGWMLRHGPTLAAASQQADTSGNRLIHGDLAPGNWCYDAAGTWRLVDWASAFRGNPIVDEVIAAIRLTRLLRFPVCSANATEHPELVAFVGGRFASELLDVDWSIAPPQARSDRIADIQWSLTLGAHLLGLPKPGFQ